MNPKVKPTQLVVDMGNQVTTELHEQKFKKEEPIDCVQLDMEQELPQKKEDIPISTEAGDKAQLRRALQPATNESSDKSSKSQDMIKTAGTAVSPSSAPADIQIAIESDQNKSESSSTPPPHKIANPDCTPMSYNESGYKSFAEFYPYYLGEHHNNINRRLHLISTTNSVLIITISLATGIYPLIFLAIAQGYGMAWVGHFFFEKNRPATFKHPIYSFMGDFRMWWEVMTLRRRF